MFLVLIFSVLSQFKMKPEVHYGEPDCPVTPPEDFPKEDELHFEIELLDFFKARVTEIHDILYCVWFHGYFCLSS